MTLSPRLKSLVVVGAAFAGLVLLSAAGYGLLARRKAEDAAATLSAVQAEPRRLPNAWVRSARPHPEPPRDERLAAGERVEAEARELIPVVPEGPTVQGPEAEKDPAVQEALRFHASGPESWPAWEWRAALANSPDERLPDPPADLVSWLDDHEAEIMRLAQRVLESPTLAWEREPREWEPASAEAHLLEGTLTLGAGVDAWRGRHESAAQKLEAAWALRVALVEAKATAELPQAMLGALRCTRVENPGEWIARLEAIDMRAQVAQQRLWSARRRLETTASDVESGIPPWFPSLLRPVVIGLGRLPGDFHASISVDHAKAAVDAIEALAPCDDPSSGVTPAWKRRGFPRLIEPPAVTAAYALVSVEQDEATLSLTQEVLALREGRELSDPCDRVTTAKAADGRTTVRVTREPHPLLAEVGLWGTRTFTFTPRPEDAPRLASAPLAR